MGNKGNAGNSLHRGQLFASALGTTLQACSRGMGEFLDMPVNLWAQAVRFCSLHCCISASMSARNWSGGWSPPIPGTRPFLKNHRQMLVLKLCEAEGLYDLASSSLTHEQAFADARTRPWHGKVGGRGCISPRRCSKNLQRGAHEGEF